MKSYFGDSVVRAFSIVVIIGVFAQSLLALGNPRLTRFSEIIFTPNTHLLAADGKIDRKVMDATRNGSKTSAVVLLSDQANVSYAYQIKDHDERGWYVYRTLSEHANRSQSDLRRYLDLKGIAYRSFWAANLIVADVDRAAAVEIAGRSDVARVDHNEKSRWVTEPDIAKVSPAPEQAESGQAIEWGVANVNAPALWEMGYTGEGIVVGGLDTGIRWTHNAIKSKYRGWNGMTADHNYNWYDAVHGDGGVCGPNTTAPCDDHGHGSHTVGTMVGDDGMGNQIGVAPGAKWIGCRNMDEGDGSPASYTECFQFMIAPTDSMGNNPNPSLRPHILNNSWSCTSSEGCTTRAELEAIVNNTMAAGIFVQSSAGNSGGAGCSSVSQALAIYDATFAAGAIDINNNLAGFSSRGPSTFYDPNILKPNITAPGSSIRSITRSGDDVYSFSSGTSMASPHVAGVIALLWSARPELVRNIAATKALLQATANPNVTVAEQTCGGIPSTQVPNNSFGYGRVDALAAFNASGPMVTMTGRVLSPEGMVVRNTAVVMSNSNNLKRTATTSSFGIFTFEGVRVNETYTLSVSSKRYRFAPQFVNVGSSNVTTADFVGLQ